MQKVLVITYYWPPSGGPGVQRILKFVKYLPQFGWEPVILTVKDGEYPVIDEALQSQIAPELKVFRSKSYEPFNLYKLITGKSKKSKIPKHAISKAGDEKLMQKISRLVRANFFIPDARAGWVKSIESAGLGIIEKEKPSVILSTSPPHSLQLGAKRLAEKSGLKWVADFRDPWTDAYWMKDIGRISAANSIDKRFERNAVNRADEVIVVSNSLIKNFRGTGRSDFHVLPNGFDEDDFKDIRKKDSDKFRIVYTGGMSMSQNPVRLFEALDSLEDSIKQNLEIDFYGSFHSSIIDSIHTNNLSSLIHIHDYIPHSEAIEKMVNADMLLLMIPDVPNNEGIITGKFFEYLATKNFILTTGPDTGDVAAILKETGSGKVVNYNEDPSGILLNEIKRWENKQLLNVNEVALSKYTRRSTTEKLSKILSD